MSNPPLSFGAELSALLHELNQPLTAILSNAQAAQRFLAGKTFDVGELRDILDDIVADDKRAAGIMKRLAEAIKNASAPATVHPHPGAKQ